MFPMTMTLHNLAQLNAVLTALRDVNPLRASDFTDPTIGAAYVEAQRRVAQNEAEAARTQKDAAEPTGKPSAAKTAPSPRTAEADPSTPAPSAAAPAQSTEQPAAQSSTAQPADVSSAEPVTYYQVARAISAAVKTNRDHVVATLAKFGAKKGPELKAAQYADFMKALG